MIRKRISDLWRASKSSRKISLEFAAAVPADSAVQILGDSCIQDCVPEECSQVNWPDAPNEFNHFSARSGLYMEINLAEQLGIGAGNCGARVAACADERCGY